MAERVSSDDATRKTRAFISYSRKNKVFTDRLAGELAQQGYKVDYDQSPFDVDNIDTGISAEDDWRKRLREMIAACEAMVFIVSPESAASRVCDEEITYARALGKRVIPILLRQIDFSKAPPRLAALNVKLSFEEERAFDASLAALTKVLDVDVAWHREGARLMALAAKWDADGRSDALLLPCGAVTDAEAWAARRPGKADPPGELFGAYLSASSAEAKADRDRLLRTVGLAYVKPAEQAIEAGRADASLRIAAAGMVLAEDEAMRLVPERAGAIELAVGKLALLAVLGGNNGAIKDAALTPDGKHVVTLSEEGVARASDLATGWEVSVVGGDFDETSVVGLSADATRAITPDGTKLAIATSGNTGRVLDVTTGREVCSLRGHTLGILSAEFDANGRRIVTGAYDNTARVWDATTGKTLAVLEGHEEIEGSVDSVQVSHAAFNGDGTRIVTAGGDRTARIWEGANQWRMSTVLRGHESVVQRARFSADGKRILTLSWDDTLRVWDAAHSLEVLTFRSHEEIEAAAFSPDGDHVVIASIDGATRVWRVADATEVLALSGCIDGASIAYSRDGSRILAGGADEPARLWDAATGQEIAPFDPKESRLAVFNRDGSQFVLAGYNGRIRVHDSASGRQISAHGGGIFDDERIDNEADPTHIIAVSPDGSRVVTSSDEKYVTRLWDAISGREISELRGHRRLLRDAAFSPDGAYLVTVADDERARLWRTLDGCEIEAPLDRAGISSVIFSFDGSRIAGACGSTVRIWDVASWRELAVLEGHEGEVACIAFSWDGNRVLSASRETAHIWDTSRTTALCGDTAEVLAACLSRGRGRRTESERAHLLMQAAPHDLFEALMARLSPDQRANVARRAEMLSRPLHPSCYLTPSQRRSGPAVARKGSPVLTRDGAPSAKTRLASDGSLSQPAATIDVKGASAAPVPAAKTVCVKRGGAVPWIVFAILALAAATLFALDRLGAINLGLGL